jgi:hypothetical protein
MSLLCAQYINVDITHRPIYQPAYHITAGLPLLFADWHSRHDTQTDLNEILLAFDRRPTSTVKVQTTQHTSLPDHHSQHDPRSPQPQVQISGSGRWVLLLC